jgi:hypothetical protein
MGRETETGDGVYLFWRSLGVVLVNGVLLVNCDVVFILGGCILPANEFSLLGALVFLSICKRALGIVLVDC